MTVPRTLTALAVLALLTSCSPAPSVISLLHQPSPSDPGQPIDAAFTVTAAGQVYCPFPLGCDALTWLQPVPPGDSSSVSSISPSQQITFPAIPTGEQGTWAVATIPTGSLTRLPVGRYKVAGEVNTISDTLPAVTTPVPVDTVPKCITELSVAAATAVTVALTFSAPGGCTIATTTVAEVDPPMPGSLGIVPDRWMTVAVSNGTTIDVTVFVNGRFIKYLPAGDCAGCQLGDGIPASILPPLPWQVEIRAPAGRVLLSTPIKSGDVEYSNSASRGDGNRVDLSCGRIDVWSGPPLLGPAPGPGTPGDCRS
jgi:hypothetical protein